MMRQRKVEQEMEINLSDIVKRLDDRDPIVLGEKALSARQALINHIEDPEIAVRISIAEALYQVGERQCSLRVINQALLSESAVIRVQALQLLESFGYDVSIARRLATTP
jgi:hypothetical protein